MLLARKILYVTPPSSTTQAIRGSHECIVDDEVLLQLPFFEHPQHCRKTSRSILALTAQELLGLEPYQLTGRQ